MTGFNRYVVGFAMDEQSNVALIRKNRPEWQAGKLNGIGGKIEPNEQPWDAMAREFEEETGVRLVEWQLLTVMRYPSAMVYVYRKLVSFPTLTSLRTMTDEEVQIANIWELLERWEDAVVPNLSWLLPFAAYTNEEYDPITINSFGKVK